MPKIDKTRMCDAVFLAIALRGDKSRGAKRQIDRLVRLYQRVHEQVYLEEYQNDYLDQMKTDAIVKANFRLYE